MTVRLYFEVDQGELIRAHEYCSNVEPPIEIDPAVWGHTFFEMPVFFEVDGGQSTFVCTAAVRYSDWLGMDASGSQARGRVGLYE